MKLMKFIKHEMNHNFAAGLFLAFASEKELADSFARLPQAYDCVFATAIAIAITRACAKQLPQQMEYLIWLREQ